MQGYRDWCQHVDLPERIKELSLEELRKGGEVVVSGGLRAVGVLRSALLWLQPSRVSLC